jgi:dTDP-glucose 4,6-dehydratase
MKILVTGCYGFIGYNFVKYLNKKYENNIEIVGIDSITNQFSKFNSKNNDNIIFRQLDINNISRLNIDIIKNIDTIVNFAAESHVDTSIYNPKVFLESNILGLAELMKFAIDNNIPNFLHVSTDEVYGSYRDDFALETSPLNPSSPYSASKASAELIASSYTKTFDYKIKTVRPANNFGKYQQPEKLIPFSIANLINGNNIEIYGDGKHVRHWLHVDDTCSAIDTIIKKGEIGNTYNIGSGVYLTNNQIATKLLSALDLNDDRLIFVKDRPGHDYRYAINFDKLSKLNWKPNEKFDSLLNDTIKWYIDNQEWWLEGFNKILENRKKRFLLDE